MSLARIHARLRSGIGLDPETLSPTAIASEIGRRMRDRHVDSLGAYADLLERDAVEFERLASALLVHETSFFRYPASFALLAREACARQEAHAAATFRVHSVACATGEEPASIAMTLLDAGLDPARFSVDATDLSHEALESARSGRYGSRVARQVPARQRARYLREDGDQWVLEPAVRERIRYREGNVVDPTFGLPGTPYDAVFCRNLLIYLVPDARRLLIDRLLAMLSPGGLLFVGHAEVAALHERGLALASPAEAFACRLVARPAPAPPRPTPAPRRPTPATTAARPTPPRPVPSRPAPAAPAPPSEPVPHQTLRIAARLADAGELEEARRLLHGAVDGGVAGPDHFHLLALVESALSRDDASEQALVKALYLDPRHYPALVQLALVADQRGERQRARLLRERAERARLTWEARTAKQTEVGHGDA